MTSYAGVRLPDATVTTSWNLLETRIAICSSEDNVQIPTDSLIAVGWGNYGMMEVIPEILLARFLDIFKDSPWLRQCPPPPVLLVRLLDVIEHGQWHAIALRAKKLPGGDSTRFGAEFLVSPRSMKGLWKSEWSICDTLFRE